MRTGLSSGARLSFAALLILAASGSSLVAQVFLPSGGPDEWEEPFEPPPSLPEGLMGTMRPKPDAPSPQQINRIKDVFDAIQACWQPPGGSSFSGQEITLRLSFKRNGEVLGKPRITYYKAGAQPEQREAFTRSVQDAFERCTPLPFTESFGRAIAGRIFAFRFSDTRPM